ncbi:30S ribosomal protein S1 [Candidatus Schneideria nysicola]|uniref:30S ribosomal protein S1 n=1 Tax=Candidatus Schneideria nysicola TaxID=1081631 RepID=UPI001CAA758C|nr:30S ribosomal protein S1 [Candidatus Schneideria nysicola]UAJ65414.1 30S ribosomal protein S1 [Candidatus Schneideria nysicola]
MTESFSQLFEASLKEIETRPGSIIRGTIISIAKDLVLVDAGLKSEATIPIDQFYNDKGELEIQVGDQVDVALDAIEGGFGETLLSRDKVKRHEMWINLERAYEKSEKVIGKINGKVKGGFTVDLNGIRAFLPGSLVDIRPIRDTFHLENKDLEFKLIKLDQKRNNIVVSRRAIIESENNQERDQLIDKLKEGTKINGIVKNLTDYGAFVDLGGIDGLLHITDMTWKRIKHPSEIVNVGDEICVRVLKFDKERVRVSLGLKQLHEDPWFSIKKRYKSNMRLSGRVTNLTDYGCFVEIEEGIEGLVHVSEMDWTNKNIHPSKVVSVGNIVEVMILDIDEERRRISLGIKQCRNNPWQQFAKNYNKGDHVIGQIKSITDFGLFIGLEGGIDGLVHLSDISWNIPGEEAARTYKKGDEIETMVLQVDIERERISLGIKQLVEDPFNHYISSNKKGSVICGKVTAFDPDKKEIVVELAYGIEGRIPQSELERFLPKEEQLSYQNYLKIGDNIDVKLSGVDRKNRLINLSLIQEKEIENNKNDQTKNKFQEEKNFYNVMTEAFKAATKE